MSQAPRDERGRFVARACPDPDCDGELVAEERHVGWPYGSPTETVWRCDGLVGRGVEPLVACGRVL